MIKQRDLGPWLVFILMFIPVFILQLVANHFTETNKELDTPTPTYALSIEKHSFCTSRYGTRAVCGTVLNNSTNAYHTVSININLYDAGGALIGNAYDSISNLYPGKQWKFEASYGANATTYDIKVSGY